MITLKHKELEEARRNREQRSFEIGKDELLHRMNFYLAQVQIRSSGYTFSSPFDFDAGKKIFIAEKCCKFMTLFLLSWQKQVKSFFLLVQPSNFFFVNRESWQMALLLFWSWKMACNVFEIPLPERFLCDFVKVSGAVVKTENIFQSKLNNFSIKPTWKRWS